MKENTNKAILVNSIILYARLGVTAICGLISTRFALQALGVDDFGLFSVVGGIISFISIFNTIMLSTSNRFIAVAIGKGDSRLINEQFNINVIIHVAIAVLVLLVAFPIGRWYIVNYVNYSGDINTVINVFNITIIGSIISFIGVPYNGLLMAKERFWFFCSIDIGASVIKVIVCYCLMVYMFANNLIIYSWTLSFLSAFPTVLFILYCTSKFREIVRIKIVRSWSRYKEVLSFSVWIGYGAIASIGKSQGAALIINNFFSTVMNTALGIANSVNHIIINLATNVSKSISPQITKSYAAGDLERSESLVCLSSKIAFLFMLLMSSPFVIAPEWIFSLWLGAVPDYVILFTHLLIIDALIGCLNAGIPDLIFASGKIKWYQLIVNTLFIMSVVVAFFVLRTGLPAYYLQITYIIFSIIVLVVRQIVLNKVVHFNNWRLLKESYLPSLVVAALFILYVLFVPIVINSVISILLAFVYLVILCFFIGLKKNERIYVLSLIKRK